MSRRRTAHAPRPAIAVRPCKRPGCGTWLQFVAPQGTPGQPGRYLPLERDFDDHGSYVVVPSPVGPRAVKLTRREDVLKAQANRQLLFCLHDDTRCMAGQSTNPRPPDAQLDLFPTD